MTGTRPSAGRLLTALGCSRRFTKFPAAWAGRLSTRTPPPCFFKGGVFQARTFHSYTERLRPSACGSSRPPMDGFLLGPLCTGLQLRPLRYSPGTPRPALCPSTLAYFPLFSTATCRPLGAFRPSQHFALAAGTSQHHCPLLRRAHEPYLERRSSGPLTLPRHPPHGCT